MYSIMLAYTKKCTQLFCYLLPSKKSRTHHVLGTVLLPREKELQGQQRELGVKHQK